MTTSDQTVENWNKLINDTDVKFIFLRAPHTASTAVFRTLRLNYFNRFFDEVNLDFKSMNGHVPLIFFYKLNNMRISTIPKIVVVRDPLDRIVSRYHHHIRREIIPENTSFREFIYSDLTNRQLILKKEFCTQCPYSVHNGKLMVTSIILFENLAEEFDIVFNKYGIYGPLKRDNESLDRKKTIHEYDVTNEDMLFIRNMLARDIRLYDTVKSLDTTIRLSNADSCTTII